MRVKHVPEPPTRSSLDASSGELETDDATNPALARIREAQAAVPLVPGREADCCTRLGRRVGFASRDVSRTWLTFLRGLGLAEETSEGFRRTRTEPTPDRVRRELLVGVVGAREIADALPAATDATDNERAEPTDTGATDATDIGATDPADTGATAVVESTSGIDAEAAFAAVRETIPRWERTRTDDWETVWRERTTRLLGWFCALGLATETVDGYRATGRLRAVIES